MAWGRQETGERRTRGSRRNVGRVPARETSELSEDSTNSQCSGRCRRPICRCVHSNSCSNTPSLREKTRCRFYTIPGGPRGAEPLLPTEVVCLQHTQQWPPSLPPPTGPVSKQSFLGPPPRRTTYTQNIVSEFVREPAADQVTYSMQKAQREERPVTQEKDINMI